MYTGNCIPALKPRLSIVCSHYSNQTEGGPAVSRGHSQSPASVLVARRYLCKSSTVTRQTVWMWLLEVCKKKCNLYTAAGGQEQQSSNSALQTLYLGKKRRKKNQIDNRLKTAEVKVDKEVVNPALAHRKDHTHYYKDAESRDLSTQHKHHSHRYPETKPSHGVCVCVHVSILVIERRDKGEQEINILVLSSLHHFVSVCLHSINTER